MRDPLVETAKPWKNPAATFAAPMPIISWFGSSSSPRRAAKLDAVAMVSVSETSTMPIAASEQRADVVEPTSTGTTGSGRRCGSDPTVATPWSDEVEHGGHDRRARDRDQHRGDLGA